MSSIVVDTGFGAKLLALSGVAEFRDEAGNVIGSFVPHFANARMAIEEDVADEELARREREDTKFTSEQVLERIRGLRK